MGKLSGWADGSPPQGTDDIGGQRGGVNKRFPHKGLIYLPHNGIINPCMDVSQRNGSTSVALTNAMAYGGPDRWAAAQVGTAAGFVQQFGVTGATGMRNSLRIGRNAGATATGNLVVETALETNDSQRYAGKRCTFSLRVATGANFSGSGFVPYIACGQGIDQSTQLQVFTGWTTQTILVNSLQSIAAGAGFTNFNFQVDVPAGTTQLAFAMYYTPSGTAGADDSIYYTDLRFYEANTDFTNFGLYRPYAQELALCQRYYETTRGSNPNGGSILAGGLSQAAAANGYVGTFWFKQRKRATPTMTYYDGANTAGKISTWTAGAATNNVTPTNPGWNTGVMSDQLLHTGGVSAIQYDAAASAELG